jgi:hypothetical protein
MSRTVSAQLCGELEERYEAAEDGSAEPNGSAFLRSVVDDGLRVKEGDALEWLGASEELRASVAQRQEEGESFDDTVRRLLYEAGQADEDWDTTRGGGILPSVVASLLAAGVALLFAGEVLAGGWLAVGGGLAGLTYVFAAVFGWGVRSRDVVDGLRDGFRDVGGVRGFLRLVIDDPVEDPTTPVERAARPDLYVPVLVALAFVLTGVGSLLFRAGLLPVIGFRSALLFVSILVVAYAIPGAMLVSALAMHVEYLQEIFENRELRSQETREAIERETERMWAYYRDPETDLTRSEARDRAHSTGESGRQRASQSAVSRELSQLDDVLLTEPIRTLRMKERTHEDELAGLIGRKTLQDLQDRSCTDLVDAYRDTLARFLVDYQALQCFHDSGIDAPAWAQERFPELNPIEQDIR